MKNEYSFKVFMDKALIGMSTGVIIALVPPALIGELAKALNLTTIVAISTFISKFLAVVIGVCIAMQFKLTPIQVGTVAITTVIGSGALSNQDGTVLFKGVGDVINAFITSCLAVYFILLIGDKLKNFTLLLLPTIVITTIGAIGLFLFPYVSSITTYIGDIINLFTTVQPILMGILISITFAFLITSPVSSAGVATAIGLQSISSGAANLGATAAGFGLAISGYRVFGFSNALAHIFGSPKLQMANLVKKPKIILPSIALAAILGALAGYFQIQGTPFSAGFGIIGLIGPINHLNIVGYTPTNILIVLFLYLIIPITFGYLFKWLFIDKLDIINEEDYKLDL